jgi:hypothetical protein
MNLRRLSCCLVVLLCVFASNPAAAAGTTKAYLLRGIFNVSVGLDALAAKLNRMGVATTVAGHMESGSVASEAIRDYRSGKVRTIILIGHSLGGAAVFSIADALNEVHIPVALVISLDSISGGPVAPNVRREVNFSIAGSGAVVTPGPGFHGHLQNIDVSRIPGMSHMAVQSMSSMHAKMIGYVIGARGG